MELDKSIHIVKKLKLVGTPFKIFKKTAFIQVCPTIGRLRVVYIGVWYWTYLHPSYGFVVFFLIFNVLETSHKDISSQVIIL